MTKTTAALLVGVLIGGGGLVLAWTTASRPKAEPEPAARAPVQHASPEREIAAPAGGARFEDESPEERFRRMLERFDTNGDGELDEGERRLAWETMRAERLAKYDTDGDGELSREEEHAARMDEFLSSERGRRLMARFDANGDGVFDEAERAAMQADFEARREERRQRLTDRFDLDGDGELNDDERALMNDVMRLERDQAREQFAAMFDADGDGQLSRDERRAGFEQMREWGAQEMFTNRYDANGDRLIGPDDTAAFLELMQQGDLAADVNMDGIVDAEDLQAFQDRVSTLDPDRPELPGPGMFFGGGPRGRGGGPGGPPPPGGG